MFKLNSVKQAIFEGFFQRITAIKTNPLDPEVLIDFGVPNYGFMLYDYYARNYTSDDVIGNMNHILTYIGSWVGNRDYVVNVGVLETKDLQFDLTPSSRVISLQSYIDAMSTDSTNNRAPKFLVTYHITYDLMPDQTPEVIYSARFAASSGAALAIESDYNPSILPSENKVPAPAKINVRLTKVMNAKAIYDTAWREVTISISGQNPFTITGDQMFHPEPMTFLTYDRYLRKLDKALTPQVSAEVQAYVTDNRFNYMEMMVNMQLRQGVAGDHRLNGYDVLTLDVDPPASETSTIYRIQVVTPFTISNSSVFKPDRLGGSWFPNNGANINKEPVTDPIIGIIPEQLNVTGRGGYFDERDPSYARQMITDQHPAVKEIFSNEYASYLVMGYTINIDRSILEYDETKHPFFDISEEGILDINIEDASGLIVTLCKIAWKAPESTSDYLETKTVIMSSINGNPDWKDGTAKYTVSTNVKLIDTYADVPAGTDLTKPNKPISALFHCDYVDAPLGEGVLI